MRELPPGKTDLANYLTHALREAGARYDRLAAQRKEWLDYATRRDRLGRITKLVEDLASGICDLDILTQDDLATRINPNDIEVLVGLLYRLSKQTKLLFNEIQQNGRPREVAEERWIVEVADIYENAFGKPARAAGSDEGPGERRGKFYRLLELSRPASFPRMGKFSLKQMARTLKQRRNKCEGAGQSPLKAGLKSSAIRIPTSYSDFDEFWNANCLGVGPLSEALNKMTPSEREQLQSRLREELVISPDGKVIAKGSPTP